MDSLDIFIEAQISWETFVEILSQLLGAEGLDETDSIWKRHVWHAFELDLIAIQDPDLEDDQGIPFSTYNLQVVLDIANMEDIDEIARFRLALARILIVKFQRRIGPKVILVQNLQKEIQIE